jgi:hypothetical protein
MSTNNTTATATGNNGTAGTSSGSVYQSNTSASRSTGETRTNTTGPLHNEEQQADRAALDEALSDPATKNLMETYGTSSQERRRGNCRSKLALFFLLHFHNLTQPELASSLCLRIGMIRICIRI